MFLGLYFRGTSEDKKQLLERWPGQVCWICSDNDISLRCFASYIVSISPLIQLNTRITRDCKQATELADMAKRSGLI